MTLNQLKKQRAKSMRKCLMKPWPNSSLGVVAYLNNMSDEAFYQYTEQRDISREYFLELVNEARGEFGDRSW